MSESIIATEFCNAVRSVLSATLADLAYSDSVLSLFSVVIAVFSKSFEANVPLKESTSALSLFNAAITSSVSSSTVSPFLANFSFKVFSKASAVISSLVATFNVVPSSAKICLVFNKLVTALSSIPTSPFFANLVSRVDSSASAVIASGLTNLAPNFDSKASAVISSLVATFNLASSSLDTIPRAFKSDTINSLTLVSSVPTSPFAAKLLFKVSSKAVFTAVFSILSVVITFFSDNLESKSDVFNTCNLASLSLDTIPRLFKSDKINSCTSLESVPICSANVSIAFWFPARFSAITSGLMSDLVAKVLRLS